jgi:hypothetical protein
MSKSWRNCTEASEKIILRASLDIFCLDDESLGDSDNLPDPAMLTR